MILITIDVIILKIIIIDMNISYSHSFNNVSDFVIFQTSYFLLMLIFLPKPLHCII